MPGGRCARPWRSRSRGGRGGSRPASQTRSASASSRAFRTPWQSAGPPGRSKGSIFRRWSGRAARLRGERERVGRRPGGRSRGSGGERRRSGFFLLTHPLRDEQWLPAFRDALGRNGDLAHVVAARQVEHDVRHHFFEDGAEAAGAGTPLDRLLGDRFERVLFDGEQHVLQLEQLLVLLGQRVLRFDEDADQGVLVERVERHRDREPAHQLGDEAVTQQVVGLHVDEGVLLELFGLAPGELLLGEADLPPPGARLDDFFEPIEGAAADEQDVLRIDLDVLLLRMLAPALGRHARHGPLEDLEQRLLHAFARDVAGDARVFRLAGDLVDLVDVHDAALGLGDVEIRGLEQPDENVLNVLTHVTGFGEGGRVRDGERHVQDARQRLGEQRLAHARRTDEHDVRLVELDLGLAALVRVDALIVVVDRDGEGLLRLLLPDHVLVQHVLDLGRRGNLGDRLGDLALLVLRQDLVAEGDAFIADVDRRAGNELPDRVLRLAAEGAAEVLIVGHLALVWESRVTGASRHFFFPSSISWKFAITWSISPYSLASSADMKRSRSMSFSMCSTGLPVCLAYSSLSLPRRYRISRAWISMSAAVPWVPPDGWCIMMRACGSAERFPLRPAASRNEPIEAAIPMQIVFTGARRNCIVS